MLMENTLKTGEEGSNLKHIFDLKGSTVGRLVRPTDENFQNGIFKPSTTLKDVNLT